MKVSVLSQKKILFTDVRHILCSDLEWYSSEGKYPSLHAPSEQKHGVYARKGLMPQGVQLRVEPAQKTDPLPKGTRLGRRIIFENGLYRSWFLDVEYPAGIKFDSYEKDLPLSVKICYVESKDGYAWNSPKSCEINVPGQTWLDGFTFFIDPVAKPDERYKAVYMAHPPKEDWEPMWQQYQKLHPRYQDCRFELLNVKYCIYGAVSGDGIHWKPISKPLMVHYSDTDTTVYYDSWLEKYVMYTRLYYHDRRIIGRAETKDFLNWGPVEPIIWPGLESPLSNDIYTNARTEYPGMPQYHLMFPQIYKRFTQTAEVRLFSSVDGICWNPVPGGPVISAGESGQWDSEFISAGKDLVPFGHGRIAVPYHGTSFPHKYPRWKSVLEAMRTGWAWWQEGRICGVVADEDGEFFTVPMLPMGKELTLNVRTNLAGEIRVGIIADKADPDGPFQISHHASRGSYVNGCSVDDCIPITGDGSAEPVHWKGQSDITMGSGEQIILHFKLRAAEIFGIEWI